MAECSESPLQDHDVRVNVVKWALPMEEIPISVTWGWKVEFEKIRIGLPEGLRFVEFLNTAKKNVRKNTAVIEPVQSKSSEATRYVGFVVRCTRIYDQLRVARRIHIMLVSGKKTIVSLEAVVRVFRPKLTIVDYPRVIRLKDLAVHSLPLHLKYIGFGNIQVRLEAKIGGQIVSYGDSIIFELLRRLWLKTIGSRSATTEKEVKKKQVTIDGAYVDTLTENLEKLIKKGNIPREVLDEQALKDIRRWLADSARQGDRDQVVRTRVEDLLLEILVDILARNPIDDVKLDNAHTRIETKIVAPITNLELIIYYRDLMLNEYEPVVAPIKIESEIQTGPLGEKRKDIFVEIPLVIEKWTEEPFLNVEEMEISEG